MGLAKSSKPGLSQRGQTNLNKNVILFYELCRELIKMSTEKTNKSTESENANRLEQYHN